MDNRRNSKINCIKALAVILVFLIHCKLPGTTGDIVSGMAAIAVPVFFAVSGYFSSGIPVDKARKRIRKLVIRVIEVNVFYLLFDIVYVSLTGDVGFWKTALTWNNLLIFLLFNESPLRGHLWFVGALLYCYVALLLYEKQEVMAAHVRSVETDLRTGLDANLSENYYDFKESTGVQDSENAKESNKSRNHFLRSDLYKIIVVSILLITNILITSLLIATGKESKILILTRNWVLLGIPFFVLGMLVHEYPARWKNHVNFQLFLLLVPAICLNFLEVFSLGSDRSVYFGTILIVWALMTWATRKDSSQASAAAGSSSSTAYGWLVMIGSFFDRYGFWIYILQIAVIKVWNLTVMERSFSAWNGWGWIKPFVLLVVTAIISVPVTGLEQKLLKRIAL